MSSRLLTERERPTVRLLQTTRTLLAMLSAGPVLIILFQADPDHRYANAVVSAAHAWAHAAFPNLIN